MASRFASLGLVLAVGSSLVLADEPKPEEKANGEKAKEAEQGKDGKGGKDAKEEGKEAVTEHKVTIAGTEIAYKATAGTLALKKTDGATRANVFYVAYTRQGLDAAAQLARPTTFCFNGGPGSSAVWLHLGAFGPQRVLLGDDAGLVAPKPPFKLTPNEHSLLDASDLVFIDPVSTGYSRPEKPDEAKQFHGFSEDIESVGDFIRLYVSKRQLWDSPKFLMGESYGAIRGAGLSQHLQSRYGMYLNGLIIVSGVLDFQTIDADGTNDLSRICFLPSLAATAHFHKKLSPERQADLPKLLKDVEQFSQTTYATALLRGNSLTAEEKQSTAHALAGFTGLPVDFILRENLRIDAFTFFRKLLEAEEKTLGRFDARVTGGLNQGDPSYDLVYGAYASFLNSYLRESLNFTEDRPYEILSRAVQPWNYSQFTNGYVSVADDLGRAMQSNPAFGVYIACAYCDLATPYRSITHTVDHLNIDPKLRQNIEFGYYQAGHMMYSNLPDLTKLATEVRAFVKKRS